MPEPTTAPAMVGLLESSLAPSRSPPSFAGSPQMGFVDGSQWPEQSVGRKPMRFASPSAMADDKNDGRWLPMAKEDSVSNPRFSKPCAEVDSVLALSPINAHDVIGKPKHAESAALPSDGCSRSTHLELAEIPARTPSSWPVIIQNGGLISNAKLPFYPPQSVDGEVASISPPPDVIHQSKEAWGNTLFGYFTDKSPHFHAVSKIARHLWARFGICHVAETANGFFLFRFSSDAHLEDCLARGPWTIGGKPLFLKRWKPGMAMIKEHHQTIPVWITLRNVPAEYWTLLGLSWIASAVGKPLHLDANTAKLERMHFARVCVEVRIDAVLPTKIRLTSGITPGEESVVEVVVEFQWNHTRRKSCWTNGQTAARGITLMESRPTKWKLDHLQSRLAPPSSKRNKPEGLKQCSLRACSSPEAPQSSHTRDLASYYIDDMALQNPITATSGNVSLSPGGKDSESASSPLNAEGKQGDCDAAAIASISSADFSKRGILLKEVFEPGTCEAPKLPITDASRLDVLGGSYCHEGTVESSASGCATNSIEALPTEGPGVTDDIKQHSGILLSQAEYKTFPIWITLSNVPVVFWTPLGLSWIASVVGKPIQLDPITERMERLSFARICVEVGIEANLPSKVCIRNPACPDQPFTEISIDYQWKPVRCGSCQKLGHRTCPPSKLNQPSVSSSGSVHSSKTCSTFPSLEKVYSSVNLCLDDLSTAVERGCSYAGPPDTPSKMKVQSSSGNPLADSGQVMKLVAGEDDQGIGKQRKNIEEIRLQLGASRARVPESEDDVGMSGSEGFGTDIPSFLSGEGLPPATEGGGSQSCLKKPKRRKKKHQKGVRRNTLL